MQIYIHRNNQQLGPFTEAEVRAQLASGAISPQDHVWWQGQANWVPLGQSTLMATLSAPSPGAAPLAPTPLPATPGVASAPAPTSKLAIWALVCGCLTLFCGLLASIPAIILGHLALGEIKKTPGQTGRGLAITGLIISYIMTTLNIIFLVCYFMYLPEILKMAKQEQLMQTVPQLPTNSPDQTPSPSDQTTNTPDQTTPAPAPTNSPDQSTNSAPTPVSPPATNSPDANTNTPPSSTPSTNAPSTSTNSPAASTNAPPMVQ